VEELRKLVVMLSKGAVVLFAKIDFVRLRKWLVAVNSFFFLTYGARNEIIIRDTRERDDRVER